MEGIVIFTDGACSQNGTWTGAWGYGIVPHAFSLSERTGGKIYYKCESEYKTTNNRMELLAIINALSDLRGYEKANGKIIRKITIISDSGYCVFPFIKYNWIDKWKSNKIKKDTLNYDLWKTLIPLVMKFKNRVEFRLIRGHGKNVGELAGFYNYYNDKVDNVCVYAREKADGVI